jgi:hypothetical protein
MATWEFASSEPVTAAISIPSGSIDVAATATDTITVTIVPARRAADEQQLLEDITVDFDGANLVIDMPRRMLIGRGGSAEVKVILPAGSSCEIRTASADVRCTGELASLTAGTASGNLAAEMITELADVKTASGDVNLTRTRAAHVTTASGDVRVSRVEEEVTAKSASGDVWIEAAFGGLAEAQTVSGDIRVGVARGRDVYLDISTISGDVSNELAPAEGTAEAPMTVQCRTVSGDITVQRAAEAASG